jgi:hypothetical protein
MNRLIEFSLSERELREVINALTGADRGAKLDSETEDFRGALALKFESALWQPYHEEIARARVYVGVQARRLR